MFCSEVLNSVSFFLGGLFFRRSLGGFDGNGGLDDFQFFRRATTAAAGRFQFLQGVVAGSHLAENGVLVVEPGCGDEGQEKLTAIRTRAGIGHRKQSLGGVFDTGGILTFKAVAGVATA